MDNVVYIINIETDRKPGRTTPYKYGIESWRIWCQKNNAKLVVLDQPILPYDDLRPNWHKVFIFDLLEQSNIDVNKIKQMLSSDDEEVVLLAHQLLINKGLL